MHIHLHLPQILVFQLTYFQILCCVDNYVVWQHEIVENQSYLAQIANINFAAAGKICILKEDTIIFKYNILCWKKSSKESIIWSIII